MISRVVSIVASFLVLAVGSRSGAESQPLGRPIPTEVTITVELEAGACRVATPSVAARETRCDDVVSYVMKTLKLRAGATFGIVAVSDSNYAEANAVIAGMRQAGYRLTGLSRKQN